MTGKGDNRSAMDRREIRVEGTETVAAEQRVERLERVVEKMLVINLVERDVLDDRFRVQELHDEHAVRRERTANAVGNRMQILEVEKHACSVDHVELPSEPPRQVDVEELVDRLDAGAGRGRRRRTS